MEIRVPPHYYNGQRGYKELWITTLELYGPKCLWRAHPTYVLFFLLNYSRIWAWDTFVLSSRLKLIWDIQEGISCIYLKVHVVKDLAVDTFPSYKSLTFSFLKERYVIFIQGWTFVLILWFPIYHFYRRRYVTLIQGLTLVFILWILVLFSSKRSMCNSSKRHPFLKKYYNL